MEPNSIALVVVLFLAAISLLWVLAKRQMLLARLLAGTLSLALATTAGIAIVNDYYGYYQNWSQLSADLSGGYAGFASTPTPSRAVPSSFDHGVIRAVTLRGAKSGITRAGLVYLPPQYFQRRYAHTRFPVVELLHGTPGRPSAWVVHLDIAGIADQLIARHAMGPMILVMPTMSVGKHFQECVDAPGALDDTYITQDVRSDIMAGYRVSTTPAEWGVAGYSSGGYCAANLALRHRSLFGAAGVMDGYFRPTDGPAAAALHHNLAAEAANNPLRLASGLSRATSPLPSFWLSAGTGAKVDFIEARAFTTALHGVERVSLYREPHAGHNFYAWQPAVPHLLAWMWTQLAPPTLHTDFPIAGGVDNLTIKARRAPGPTHRRKHAPAILAHAKAARTRPTR